jgi:hypothetical protein
MDGLRSTMKVRLVLIRFCYFLLVGAQGPGAVSGVLHADLCWELGSSVLGHPFKIRRNPLLIPR